jgi:gamma-glutamyl-gamma-aminobutyrate hydrolase PuuD
MNLQVSYDLKVEAKEKAEMIDAIEAIDRDYALSA